jgi:hypothetical protein
MDCLLEAEEITPNYGAPQCGGAAPALLQRRHIHVMTATMSPSFTD